MTEDPLIPKGGSRALRWGAIVLGAVVALLAIAVGILLTADLGRFKPLVESVASDALEKEVRIEGELSIRLGRHLRVDAQGLRVRDAAAGANQPEVTAGHVFVDLATMSLVRGPLSINSVLVEDVTLRVDTTREATAAEQTGEGALQLPVLHDVRIANLRVDVIGEEATTSLLVDDGTLQTDAGSWVLDVGGKLNDEALKFEARFGPVASIGRDEPLALQVAGRFGLIQLESEFSTTSAKMLENPALGLRVQGGDAAYLFSLLNMPEITSGPLDVAIDLRRSGDGEPVRLDGRGQLGEFSLQANGNVDKLLEPKEGDFDLQLSGPNLGRVAALLGVKSLPETSFSATAGLRIEPSVVHVDRLHVENAGAVLDASGRLGRAADFADSQVELRVLGPDIVPFATLLGLPPKFGGSFEATAGLDTSGGSEQALALDARVGEIRARVKADKLPLPGNQRARLSVELAGPDLAILDESVEEMLKAPLAWDVAGNVELQGDVILFEGMRVTAGEDEAHILVDGRVEAAAKSAALKVNAETRDVRHLLGRFGIDAPVEGALALETGVTVSPERVSLAEIRLVQQEGTLTGALDVALGADPLTVRFDLGVDKLSLAGVVPAGKAWRPADLPVSGTIKGTYQGDRVAFDNLHLVAGDAVLDSKGQVDLSGKAGSTLTFNLRAPSLAALLSSNEYDIPAAAFNASGNVASNSGAVRLTGTTVELGRSQLGLAGEYRPGDRPFLQLTADSRQIDLTEFLDPPTEKKPEEKTEKADRVIPDVAFPTELLDAYDLSVQVNLATVLAHRMDFNGVHLQAQLANGALTFESFGFDSTNGSVNGTASYVPGQEGRNFKLDMRGQQLRLAGPVRETPAKLVTRPATDFDVSMTGVGDGLRAVLGSLDGEAVMEMSAGRMPLAYRSWLADVILGDFAFEFLNTLNPLSKRPEDINLDCAVVLVRSEKGLVSGKPLAVFRTSRMTVFGLGTINLATEAIDLDFNTQLRKGIGVSIGDVVNPYTRIGGTLAAPALRVDERGALLEGGAAIATGGLTVLAKGLHGRFLSDQDPCKTAVENFRAPK